MESLGPELLKLVQIIWINIILSGDNAVVIAMACRGLPPDKQRPGMVLGALVAVLLRIVFTVVVAALLATPFLKIVGGCLLLWISVKLVLGEDEEGSGVVEKTEQLWHAIRTVAIADAVMSLDNVLAIAAVAKDSITLLILGLVISVPLIVAGSAIIMALLGRLPILVWAGAALLGWVAGEMLVSDPWLLSTFGEELIHRIELPAAAIGAVFVVALGYVLSRRAARHRAREQEA
ncbi:MAG TPA: TerC family protein [Rhizobiaceae bacterium]|nr:TerC family protein [Rhizobiaceae bacterium]